MTFPETLKKAVRDRKTIPFIGAGVSMAVKARHGNRTVSVFPNWKQLLEGVADRLTQNQRQSEANLVRALLQLDVPDYLEAAKRARDACATHDWYDFLKEKLDPNFDESYEGLELAKAIWSLGNNLIITTNYDNVLSWVCVRRHDLKKWVVESAAQMASFLRRETLKPTVWHLHGSIDEPESLILTPDGYSSLYPTSSNPALQDRQRVALQTLQSVIREYTLLFIGFSMDDRAIGDQLQWIAETFNGATGHHFMLVRKADYELTRLRLRNLENQIELIPFEDFGTAMVRCVEDLAALKYEPVYDGSEPSTTFLSQEAKILAPSIPPLPVLDKTNFEQRFIGRERLLGDIDDALDALLARARGEGNDRHSGDAQIFWIHGFGGMGKSWLLRRSYIKAQEEFPDVRVAFVDWDTSQWRQPLTQPPIDGEQLLGVIAYRLAQIFGVDALHPYWAAWQRVRAAKEIHTDLQMAFKDTMNWIVDENRGQAVTGTSGHAVLLAAERHEGEKRKRQCFHLEKILRGARLWSDNPEALQRLMKGLTEDATRKGQIFEQWAERIVQTGADRAAYEPDRLLTETLQDCLLRLCNTSPVMLTLDTCEVLSAETDSVLRRFLAPLVDQSTPLFVLIGSRLPPDAAIRELRGIGWRNEIQNRLFRIIPFNEQVRFTVDEIDRAVNILQREPPDDPELVERLHAATMGVPLALRALFDLHEDGDNVLVELASLQGDFDDWDSLPAMRHVYERISDRFLLHLERENREDELRDVTAIALFRKLRGDVLKSFWGCASIKDRLRLLESRYSLVSDNDLHASVREFLRRRWRYDPPSYLTEIAHQLSIVVEESIAGVVRPEELEYMEWMLDRCEVASWLQTKDPFCLFARTMVVALAFEHDIQPLVALAEEIPAKSGPASKAKHVLKSYNSYYLSEYLSPIMIEWLNKRYSSEWSEMESACLHVLNAFQFANSAKYEEALKEFEVAFSVFGKNLPQRHVVARKYLEAAFKLQGKQLSSKGLVAYQWARDLDFAKEDSAVYIGHLLHNLGRYEEAEMFYKEVIAANPNDWDAHNALAHLLHLHVKERLDEAEEAYKRALDLAHGWGAHIWRGLAGLYTVRGCLDKAEEAYRKVIEEQPSFDSWYDLAVCLLRQPARRAEAEEAMRQGGSYGEPKDANRLNHIAWESYKHGVNLEVAENFARKALKSAPRESYIVHTLACILMRRGDWTAAKPLVQKLFEEGYINNPDNDDVPLLRDIIKMADVKTEVAQLLVNTNGGESFLPLKRALQSAISNTSLNVEDLSIDQQEKAMGILRQIREPE